MNAFEAGSLSPWTETLIETSEWPGGKWRRFFGVARHIAGEAVVIIAMIVVSAVMASDLLGRSE